MAKFPRSLTSAGTGAKFSLTLTFLWRARPTRVWRRSNVFAPSFEPMRLGPRSWWTGRAYLELKRLGREARHCDYSFATFPGARTMPHASCADGFKAGSSRTTSAGAECGALRLSEVKHPEPPRHGRIPEEIP